MDGGHYADDMASAKGYRPKLEIAGRPRQGKTESLVLLTECEEVLTHYRGHRVPHFRRNCPHCLPDASGVIEEPVPYYYCGGVREGHKSSRPLLVELSLKCWESAMAAAREHPAKVAVANLFGETDEEALTLVGLRVQIVRADCLGSPRVLRCGLAPHRLAVKHAWPYRVREELARAWGVPTRPRIYREEQA